MENLQEFQVALKKKSALPTRPSGSIEIPEKSFGRTILDRSGISKNKPRTTKIGAISKAQNGKGWGGPFGLCELQLVAKNEKKLKGSLWGHEKISQKIFLNEIFEQCHSAEKFKKGDPLRFFDIHCVAKYRIKSRGDPLV